MEAWESKFSIVKIKMTLSIYTFFEFRLIFHPQTARDCM